MTIDCHLGSRFRLRIVLYSLLDQRHELKQANLYFYYSGQVYLS